MMGIDQALILALIQGFTEFLPISSSAHLVLVPALTDWPDQGVAFDVAVHVGTLSAVVAYFRKELRVITADFFTSLNQRELVGESKLAWWVLLGTIPVGLLGLTFKATGLDDHVRSIWVIAATTIIFGLLLGYADKKSQGTRNEMSLSFRDAMIIGCAQAIALFPGTSRSGITITAALLIGLMPSAAARFSFLLSIPAIILPGGVEALGLLDAGFDTPWSAIFIGMFVSGITAYLTIHFFLKLLEKISMTPFVIYRMVLGVFLIFWGAGLT